MKTGKQASDECADSLLSVKSRGEAARNQFLNEVIETPSRFEEPIKKIPLVNFASESFQNRNKSALAKKVAEVKGTRDLYSRLIWLAAKGNLDLEQTLTFPTVPNPPSMSHHDGSMRKNRQVEGDACLRRDGTVLCVNDEA